MQRVRNKLLNTKAILTTVSLTTTGYFSPHATVTALSKLVTSIMIPVPINKYLHPLSLRLTKVQFGR